MTWSINISGHDDLSGDEKSELEGMIVAEAKDLVRNLMDQEGNRVISATANTNTTGSVDLVEESK